MSRNQEFAQGRGTVPYSLEVHKGGQYNEVNTTILARHPEHGEIGHLEFGGEEPFVESVGVHPDFQRQGIATAMWQRAKQINPDVFHSSARSVQGDAWARKVGGFLPKPDPDFELEPDGSFPDASGEPYSYHEPRIRKPDPQAQQPKQHPDPKPGEPASDKDFTGMIRHPYSGLPPAAYWGNE